MTEVQVIRVLLWFIVGFAIGCLLTAIYLWIRDRFL